MKKNILIPIFLLSLLFSCTSPSVEENKPRSVKGNVVYGGTLRINKNRPMISLYPPYITDLVSSHVSSQIYEGLVKFDSKDLSILPSLATKWEIDSSGTIYTFTLKKGVFFHDDQCFAQGKGRELKASDIKYTFELLSTPSPFNHSFNFTLKGKLKGADEFYESSVLESKPELSGIKVIDDYTFQLFLNSPNSTFLYILASPSMVILAEEAVKHYGHMLTIGTGPFMYSQNNNSGNLILTRNSMYHGYDVLGNQLPYLDSIEFSFIESKKEELVAFQAKKVDLIIGLPSESIREVVENQIGDFKLDPPNYILDRSLELVTQFYEFNTTNSIFKDKRLRQAFSYAVDKNRIFNDVILGEAFGPGIHGISPPSFIGYDITAIKGYDFDPEKARKLLSEAGYPNGKNFPSIKLSISSGESKNTAVALEFSRQIKKVLNVDIELEILPYSTLIENSKYAKGDITRSAWIADYPSPESFLSMFYGTGVPLSNDLPSFPNTTRFVNTKFDSLFQAGVNTVNQRESYNFFLRAEQLMIEEAPVMVLWYDEKYRLYQSNVRNFHPNPINYWDFSQVYKDK
ncbi:MAG: ABC transporter substrate-binding protein [Bacteroidetes bacterium]|nr:ABC transporter substrate-binding protein [Bacteroidota bacterium]HET6244420.1 ABC transporter substrate-binding protein [Bacteroidia bacterium]